MLQASARPQWSTVVGGSASYVQAMAARWPVQVRLATPVHQVQRRDDGGGVQVVSGAGSERFDQVVLACHSDQALALLAQPAADERELLGAIGYQRNATVLHTDASVLPRNGRAWSAWNALVPAEAGSQCTVSYLMNHLQRLDAPAPLIVSLNLDERIDPGKVIARMVYHHPVYSHAAVAAQARLAAISGRDRLWFAGAWLGWGFHEDGVRSAVAVARGLGVDW
jgi:predicted NAD/FAD-binding protein